MMKKGCFTSIIAGFVFLLVLAESAPADLVNGDFSKNFTGNTYVDFDPDIGWVVTDPPADDPVDWVDDSIDPLDAPAALFYPDNPALNSTLSQIITVEAEFPVLSFDLLMVTQSPGHESDVFTAFLGGVKLYQLSSSDLIDDGVLSFEEAVTRYLPAYDIDPGSYELVFNLKHDYIDGEDKYGHKFDVETTVLLDNVALVPVPGALVLGSIGLSLAGCWLGKRRTL